MTDNDLVDHAVAVAREEISEQLERVHRLAREDPSVSGRVQALDLYRIVLNDLASTTLALVEDFGDFEDAEVDLLATHTSAAGARMQYAAGIMQDALADFTAAWDDSLDHESGAAGTGPTLTIVP